MDTIGAVLDPTTVVRLVADRGRLAVLGALAVAPCTAEDLAGVTRLGTREVRSALGRLCAGGLVVADAGGFRLDGQALQELSASLTVERGADPSLFADLEEDDAALAARYFKGRRLVEIPAAEGRRRAVLRRLLDEFEPGRYYSEDEVRRILRRFHPDDAGLRRHLVDDGMLARDSATRTYWRGGGPPPG
jgi:hypothetical protein